MGESKEREGSEESEGNAEKVAGEEEERLKGLEESLLERLLLLLARNSVESNHTRRGPECRVQAEREPRGREREGEGGKGRERREGGREFHLATNPSGEVTNILRLCEFCQEPPSPLSFAYRGCFTYRLHMRLRNTDRVQGGSAGEQNTTRGEFRHAGQFDG